MDKETLSGLATLLETGIKVSTNNLPDSIQGSEFVEESHPRPSTCLKNDCQALIKSEIPSKNDHERAFVCHEGHTESTSKADLTRYKFQPEPTLRSLSAHLGLTPTDTVTERLPKFATISTEERIDVCLIANPLTYGETVEDLIKTALREHHVLVILTPRETVAGIIQVAESYPIGSLICPLSLPLLTRQQRVQEIVSNARLSRDRTEEILLERGLEFNDTIDTLAENPSLIEAALTYLRVLREEGVETQGLGAQFEEVCKAAFASTSITTQLEVGGTANRGEKVPDIVIGFDADPTASKEYPKAIGVVDTKSGSTGNFSSEKIAGKHTDYLKQIRRSEIYRNWHVSHIFIVFDIDGYKEIDWFDEIRDAYQGYDDDVTMVVMYADALRELVAGHQNLVQHSELKRASANLSRVIRPFFDHHQHNADWVPLDLSSMVRVDDEKPTKREQEYIREYDQRSQLLVVTPEMVDRYLRSVYQNQGEWDKLLPSYSE